MSQGQNGGLASLDASLRRAVADEVRRALQQMGGGSGATGATGGSGAGGGPASGTSSGGASSSSGGQTASGQSSTAGGSSGNLVRRLANATKGGGGQSSSSKQGMAGSSSSGGGSAQSVSQLAKAQEALRQDLSNNLKKLRQVIGESEEIARKMEAVLGAKPPGSPSS